MIMHAVAHIEKTEYIGEQITERKHLRTHSKTEKREKKEGKDEKITPRYI